MQIIRLSLILTLMVASSTIKAQSCDYISSRFDVEVEEEVFYGVETLFDGQEDSLFLNIFKPKNNNDLRPLIIWCFGGGFNQGNKESFNDVCRNMAKQGFVAVTIDYRLGYVRPNFLSYPLAYDTKELIRAGYRAMQDLKGAIRFMKGRHIEDAIDLDNVFIGGASAGAITALAAAFLDQSDEKDLTILGDIGKAQILLPIERPDLGPVEGTTHVGEYDATVKGVVNIFGAVFDTTHIEASDKEVVYSYHQTNDPVVACGHEKAYHGFPFISSNMPFGFGSCILNQRFTDLGWAKEDFETWIYDGNQHSIHDQAAVFSKIAIFLQYHICDKLVDVADFDFDPILIYPNPADEEIHLELPQGIGQVFLLNNFGQKVMTIKSNENSINIHGLPSGHYHFLTGEGVILGRLLKM